MAKDDDFISYKDISKLKGSFDENGKSISNNELYQSVNKLAEKIGGMMEVFAAASDQMRYEEHDAESKKHEMILLKLDKIIEQNKTIAQGMVAIADMVKEKHEMHEEEHFAAHEKAPEEPKPAEQASFMKPNWQEQPQMQPMQMQPMNPPPMPSQGQKPAMSDDFGMGDFGQMPPMEPAPPGFDFPEESFPLDNEPKKKGLLGMFKK